MGVGPRVIASSGAAAAGGDDRGRITLFSHVNLGITDFRRAFAFYGAVLGPLGLVLRATDDTHWAAWVMPGTTRPLLVINQPFDGGPATTGNGQMTALLAPSRDAVRSCHALALEHGGRDEGAPGVRPEYHAQFYGAYVRDPDGNKLCVVCHDRVDAEASPPDHRHGA